MPETIQEVKRVLTRDQYGTKIEKLKVGASPIKVPPEHREKITQYIKRKYNGERTYRTITLGNETLLFREK
jgi:hypothetical protein